MRARVHGAATEQRQATGPHGAASMQTIMRVALACRGCCCDCVRHHMHAHMLPAWHCLVLERVIFLMRSRELFVAARLHPIHSLTSSSNFRTSMLQHLLPEALHDTFWNLKLHSGGVCVGGGGGLMPASAQCRTPLEMALVGRVSMAGCTQTAAPSCPPPPPSRGTTRQLMYYLLHMPDATHFRTCAYH